MYRDSGLLRFIDREAAGRELAQRYEGRREGLLILGIPRGGLAVGMTLAQGLDAELDVIVTRKLPVPWSPELGFGAIAPDGSISLNPEVLDIIGLRHDDIRDIASEVLEEVKRRERVYRGERPFPVIAGRNVLIVDDGLATGYTMIAAIHMLRNMEPAWLGVAVPVGPADTVEVIRPMADYLLCPIVAGGAPFAVASYYEDFHDMNDAEVIRCLERARAAAN